jgi:hypothetical protein
MNAPGEPSVWRRGVYVHDWGTGLVAVETDRGVDFCPPVVWWAVVLAARGWEVDGVWLVRHSPAAEAANLPLPDLISLYHGMRFGPDRLRLPAALPAGLEAELLERAQREWVAAGLGGYLPDAGEMRTVRVGPPP